jgi:chromosome partitioning protein
VQQALLPEGGKMKKIFVIANQKGGIGKTTTATAMASILNDFGHKTLLIDADPSGNSTDTFHGEVTDTATLYDVMLDTQNPTNLEDAIQHTKYGDLIASDPLLVKADTVCNGDPNGMFRLSDAIDDSIKRGGLDDYEYIIIDTQPVINMLLNNCLVAADAVIIPVTTDRYAITGLYKLKDIIDSIKRRANTSLEIYGLLLCKMERLKISRTVMESLAKMADDLGTVLIRTVIRSSKYTREAQLAKMPLIEYSRSCTTELDYEDFINLILEEESEV